MYILVAFTDFVKREHKRWTKKKLFAFASVYSEYKMYTPNARAKGIEL